jgi:hypothetical protein
MTQNLVTTLKGALRVPGRDYRWGSIRKGSLAAVVALAWLTLPALASTGSFTEPASGTTFERRPSAGGETFVCLGSGVRRYLVWKLYAMDFCVEEGKVKAELDRYFSGPGRVYANLPSKELAQALADDARFFDFLASMQLDQRAEIVFLHDSDAEKVRDSFAKNLEKGLGSSSKAAIRDFVSGIDHDVKTGDRTQFVTHPVGELTFTSGTSTKTLKHALIARSFWRGYFGPDSPLPSLKESVATGVAFFHR